MNEPTRPALRWHGGKWVLAPWIIAHFPQHRCYVEPFGGAASVLLRKPRTYAEIYNDLDDDVVNLFRVLQDKQRAAEIVDRLLLTPFSRKEFHRSFEHSDDDLPVDRALKLIIRSFMGFGSNSHACQAKGATSTGFRAQSTRSGTTPAHDWAHYPPALKIIIERIAGVVIESRPAMQVMASHDDVWTLHYVDPPYLHEPRSLSRAGGGMRGKYRFELSDTEHVELLTFLRTLKGMVVLSGYPAPLYDNALHDWRRVERPALADGARDRTEVIWINPLCADRLDRQALPLFADAAE